MEKLDINVENYSRWLVPGVLQSEADWTTTTKSNVILTGKEADLITFNPIFNPRQSGWYWEHDIQSESVLIGLFCHIYTKPNYLCTHRQTTLQVNKLIVERRWDEIFAFLELCLKP